MAVYARNPKKQKDANTSWSIKPIPPKTLFLLKEPKDTAMVDTCKEYLVYLFLMLANEEKCKPVRTLLANNYLLEKQG